MKVGLRPLLSGINLPTVLKTAILPGDTIESLFVATQVGEIFYIRNGSVQTFLDIRQRIIKLGVSNGGYDERGLLGLAFHPGFYYNGLFYLHYSVAGTQGPGALSGSFRPDPCKPDTLNLKWTNRETNFDHIDTVEEWILQPSGQPQKRRRLLNLRRPFFNHNGVNSLNFSPETGKLIIITGDGGSGYDPFNLSQNPIEIAGKILEMDVNKMPFINDPPVATRFNELPRPIQESLSVMALGVRNSVGISFQRFYNQYIKVVGNVGQAMIEAIYSFVHYQPVPVVRLIQNSPYNRNGLINFGWRGWEGDLPTITVKGCSENSRLDEKIIAFFDEAIKASVKRLKPLTSYYHQDPRPDKFQGISLTGVQVYMGNGIPALTGSVVFTDFAESKESQKNVRGVLAYTRVRTDGKTNDFHVIETNDDFGSQFAYYTSLGTNLNQTRLYLGVHGSSNVTDYNKGTVYEIVP